jgi:cell division septation protein DedD
MSDEQFHEFHLDGKQMVFLFMASTVVAVVIFLCGVMVGRGVRASQVEPVEFDRSLGADPEIDPEATAASQRPATGLAVPGNIPDESELLDRGPADAAAPPLDVTPEPQSEPAPAPMPSPARAERVERPAGSAPPPGALREPPGDGWSVQVMSLTRFDEAETARRSLIAKNYRAFIVRTPDGTRYRVRVGKYPIKRDAQVVADRLRKVEQFTDAFLVK